MKVVAKNIAKAVGVCVLSCLSFLMNVPTALSMGPLKIVKIVKANCEGPGDTGR